MILNVSFQVIKIAKQTRGNNVGYEYRTKIIKICIHIIIKYVRRIGLSIFYKIILGPYCARLNLLKLWIVVRAFCEQCAMGRTNFTVRTRWNFNWPLPALAITKHNRICSTVWTVIDKSAIRYRIATPGSICVSSGKSTKALSLECKRNKSIYFSMYNSAQAQK